MKYLVFLTAMATATPALAQSPQCEQLFALLESIPASVSSEENQYLARRLEELGRDVAVVEDAYVRDGCNAAAASGYELTGYCQDLAYQVLDARDAYDQAYYEYEQLAPAQRDLDMIEADIAALGCSQNPFPSSEYDDTPGSEIPWSPDPDISGTVRTLCVRESDGYYWPISYSTTAEYLSQDEATCQAACPDGGANLFYHANPGEEPEAMVNLAGDRYAEQSYAFVYRDKLMRNASCPMAPVISETEPETNKEKPAPPPDMVSDIPLPRPRPDRDAPPEVAAPEPEEDRIAVLEGRRIRVVGPPTPYAQTDQPTDLQDAI